MAVQKTRATGWIGSRFVGLPAPSETAVPRQPVSTTQPVAPPQLYSWGTPPTTPVDPEVGYAPTNFGGGDIDQQNRQIGDASRAPAPLGFDARKWADPTQGTSQKYTSGRTLEAGGTIDDVLRNPQFAGWTKVSGDKMRSPDGNIYDITYDVGGPQQRTQHTLVGGPRWDAEQNNGYQGNIGGATGRGTPQGDAKYAAYLASGGRPIPGPQPGGASGSSSSYPGSGSYPGAGAEFDDPWGANLEGMVGSRLNALGQNPASPQLDAYLQMLMGKEKAGQARAGEFANTLRTRAGELNQAPYTTQQEDVMRTRSVDQLERRRQQTLKNRRDEVYARGFEPTSGLVRGEEQQVNQGFDQAKQGVDADLLYNSMAEGQRRRDQAVSLEGLAQQALEGGDLGSLNMMAQATGLENQQYAQREGRAQEALNTAQLPLSLMNSRQGLGIQALNAGQQQDPMQAIMQMLQYGQQQQQIDQTGRNNNMQGMGAIAQALLDYYGKRR
jgi:hypothetical protein